MNSQLSQWNSAVRGRRGFPRKVGILLKSGISRIWGDFSLLAVDCDGVPLTDRLFRTSGRHIGPAAPARPNVGNHYHFVGKTGSPLDKRGVVGGGRTTSKKMKIAKKR